MNLEQLFHIATQFREALESLPATERPIGLQKFPRGSCGDATLLLGTYLIENGFPPFNYMRGERQSGIGVVWVSHAWLERNGVIVDITADQFPDGEGKVLVLRESTWHSAFCGVPQNIANYRIYDQKAVATLDAAYKKICLRLNVEMGPKRTI